MKSATAELSQVMDRLDAIRQELSRLGQRVAALEADAAKADEAVSAPGISEDLILVIGAAIAAFLGKKPHIRQIRLLGSASWAQQGRATIQASHSLTVHHSQ